MKGNPRNAARFLRRSFFFEETRNRNVGAVGRKSYDFTGTLNARSVLLSKTHGVWKCQIGQCFYGIPHNFSIFFSFSGCTRSGITGSPCTENVTYVRHACLMPKNTCKQMGCSWIDGELGNLASLPRNQTKRKPNTGTNKNQATTLPPNEQVKTIKKDHSRRVTMSK